jgi:hypothetical protein
MSQQTSHKQNKKSPKLQKHKGYESQGGFDLHFLVMGNIEH